MKNCSMSYDTSGDELSSGEMQGRYARRAPGSVGTCESAEKAGDFVRPGLMKLGLIVLVFSPYCPVWAQNSGGSLTVQIGASGTPPLSLVNHGDVWRYRKGTSAPPAG